MSTSDDRSATARVERLNAMLRGIRGVHRLVARGEDAPALLEGAAQALVEARGFPAVAIAHTAPPARRFHLAGDPEQLAALRRTLERGTLPRCLHAAVHDGPAARAARSCADCAECAPDATWTMERDAIAVPMEHGGRRFGAVMVALQGRSSDHAEEAALLRELADDLALALHHRERDARLRETDRCYRLMVENATDVVSAYDLVTGRFLYMSPSVEHLRGYPLSAYYSDAPPPQTTPSSAEYLSRVMPARIEAALAGSDERHADEVERPRADGTTVWTETVMRFVRDEETGHLVACSVSRDITERRRAQQALEASAARYRSLFESMVNGCAHSRLVRKDGVAVDWEFLSTNAAYRRITGFTQPEGRRMTELVPGFHEVNPCGLEAYTRAVETGEPQRFEAQLRHSGRWVSLKAHRTDNDEFLVIAEDITDRRQAEEALRESEQRYRSLFESMPSGCAHSRVVRKDGVVVDVELLAANDAFRRLTGLLDPENRRLSELLPGIHDRHVEGLRRAARVVDTGEPERFEAEIADTGRWMAATLHRSGPDELVIVADDITERHRADEALRARERDLREHAAELERRVAERTAALERAARAKDDFLASMSHELRTPLNGILGLSEALTEGVYGPLQSKQVSALARVGESGKHLLELINDILDLAKVEAGKIELQLAEISLTEICRASLRLVQESATRKRLSATISMAPDLPLLHGDERRLRQVVVNLLTNAVKFTPEGGAIGVEVEPARGGEAVRVTVWDTGIGIAAADRGRLFKPFVQLDSRLSREQAGTGLGLALVLRLVELHGGEVHVESEPNRGSRFTILIPVRKRDPAPPPAPAPRPPTPPRGITPGRTVLVADDYETNLELLRDVLSHRGYAVHTACDGQEAITQAEALCPDVIVMDMQMPGVDGLSAIRALRAAPRTAQTAIVALTALAMPGDEERCLAAGADGYLSKPVPLPRLFSMIERLVEARAKG